MSGTGGAAGWLARLDALEAALAERDVLIAELRAENAQLRAENAELHRQPCLLGLALVDPHQQNLVAW